MVRVWIRPALAALSRQAAKNAAARAGVQQALFAQQHVVAVRAFSSKKDKGIEKKSIHDKFVEDDDLTEVPPEVEYLAKENLDPELLRALVEADLEVAESDSDSDEDVDENTDGEDELAQLEKLLEESEDGDELDVDDDDEDAGLTDAEWAAKYERELAEVEAGVEQEVEDDRLYIEMPNYDTSLSMASEGDMDDDDDESADPFAQWEQGAAYSPEMLNWMLPREKRQPFTTKKEKPWKYFVRANHPDPVELAMDVDLLRLFISPTGRIRPRRFTGLTAKQQRQLARAVKISRQLALLPYLSRYPEPSPEQWRAMEEEEIAKLTALAELDDGSVDDDDDDDDDFEDMDEE